MFSFTQSRQVQATAELARIVNLPRRNWQPAEALQIAKQLTDMVKQPHGTMSLRPIQAMALVECGMQRGLFGPIRVGGGKTLISLLCPFMVGSLRPLLILPAKLRKKTHADMRMLSQHFKMPMHLRIISYEKLSRPDYADWLEDYCPDLIVADESHKLRNLNAALTRRMVRFMQFHPACVFVALSGTMTKRSLLDYHHIMRWCLKDAMPMPRPHNEVEEWSDALDEKVNPMRRLDPGQLIQLCNEQEREDWRRNRLSAARRAYRRRLVETPAVVATNETPLDMPLVITSYEPPVNEQTEQAFSLLREWWVTPDGWDVIDGMTAWRHARELALGLFYRWNPRPPDPWQEARKAWAKACREIIKRSRSLDSEATVAQAILHGQIICPEYLAWVEVRDTFQPNTECVWLDDSVLRFVQEWMHRPGIVWVEHTFFAEALEQLTGAPYYGRGGLNRNGQPIERADPERAVIASIASNSEGRNLQHYNRNLIVGPLPNGTGLEQLLGRTHRDGQLADEVTADLVVSCLEHVTGFWQSVADARYVQDTQGVPMKVLSAELNVTPLSALIDREHMPRWSKMQDEDE